MYNVTITNCSWKDSANYFTRLDFTAIMYNNSAFLINTCSIKPVTGNCYCALSNGTASYNSLQCVASGYFVIPTYFSDEDPRLTTAAGFNAIAYAFIDIFSGAAWPDISGAPQSNTTFTELAIEQGPSNISFPSGIISQMRRVIWNIPFRVHNGRMARMAEWGFSFDQP